MPKQHPLSKENEIQVSMLQNQPFIVVSRNIWPELYDDIVTLCRNAGFSLQIKQEATEYQTVLGLIAAGIGIAVVPASMKNYSVKDVVYREISGANLSAKMAIAYQKDRLTPEASNFIKLIRKLK